MYCLVYYPHINITAVNSVRSKFDQTISFIDPHITVVFPFPETIPEEEVARHIESVLQHWTPFEVHLYGFEKSWDHWLFLSVAEGKAEFIRLHDELYTGLLAPYLWKAIPYAPHIGLGLFVQKVSHYDLKHPQQLAFDEERYHRALHEAQVLQLDYISKSIRSPLSSSMRTLRTFSVAEIFRYQLHRANGLSLQNTRGSSLRVS